MGVVWTKSAGKHGIPRADALHAMMNFIGSEEVDGEPDETTMVYVGHPHGQTDRHIEVIAAIKPPSTLIIFHAMPLTDNFAHLLHERPLS